MKNSEENLERLRKYLMKVYSHHVINYISFNNEGDRDTGDEVLIVTISYDIRSAMVVFVIDNSELVFKCIYDKWYNTNCLELKKYIELFLKLEKI